MAFIVIPNGYNPSWTLLFYRLVIIDLFSQNELIALNMVLNHQYY